MDPQFKFQMHSIVQKPFANSSPEKAFSLCPGSALRGKPATLMNLIISFSADVGMSKAGKQNKSCIRNIPTNIQIPSTQTK